MSDLVPEMVPLDETAHLLRSPENARRLTTAIERLEAGGGACDHGGEVPE